ncbi:MULTISPECIES: TIGR04053 family radical SAM/SPASM domain-containing protein [Rhodococcus]|uniref:TIGR04053 family radical SAM/SPASM domain-containing protein n=1 Tax=Rhodococcus TaxID=1827 RepID=UPI001CF9067A|nr:MULTISPECIES: TIGR04053 family radical SAM/SPASM domain-containing protein [Rhodococcus]
MRHDPNERPFIVIWEVTRACALACAHCRADAIRARNPLELTTVEGFRLLDRIAAFGTPRPIVVLTGGDPFERPDLPELVRYGTGIGLHVALSPSVTPRLTEPVLRELHDAGATAVSLSLDGATAAGHDGFRGIDGVFDRTLQAARTVKDVGYRLQINTTVTAGNAHELPDILATVVDLGASLWSVFFLVPTGRGSRLGPLDPAGVEDVLHWLHDVGDQVAIKTTEAPHFRRVALQRAAGTVHRPGPLGERLRVATSASGGVRTRPARPPMDVNAGRGFAFIDHLGDVYPSGFLPVVAGSVREQHFDDIYRTSPVMRALRDPDGFGGKCGLCEYRQVCGGSRSHAYAVTGDLLAADPACVYEPSATRD